MNGKIGLNGKDQSSNSIILRSSGRKGHCCNSAGDLGNVLLRLHSGEKEDFLDVALVGQKHGETIDAQAPTASGRESVLQSDAKILVAFLRCRRDEEKREMMR